MTVVVALTYPGGAVVASDSRRMDPVIGGGCEIGSDRFVKTFRRDWDHVRAPNARYRLVIGGVSGQMHVAQQRLTGLVEHACYDVDPPSLRGLKEHLIQCMGRWIVRTNGSDILLVAADGLGNAGAPQIAHLRATRHVDASEVAPTDPAFHAIGSGAAHALEVLRGEQWRDESTARHVAREAIERAKREDSNCGGETNFEIWPG